MKHFIAMVLILLLSACVYVPKQIMHYDEECDIELKKYVLKKEDLSPSQVHVGIESCADETCVALFLGHLAGYAIIGPLSAVVSGSVVITGNTIHWLEKQGRCHTAKE